MVTGRVDWPNQSIAQSCLILTGQNIKNPYFEEFLYYRKSPIKPPWGFIFSSTFEGGGGLKERWAYLI